MENAKNKLNNDQKKFIDDNINLLSWFYYSELKKNIIPDQYKDDFLSNLGEAFCKAVKTYNSEEKVPFTTYVCKVFDNSKIDLLRKIRTHNKTIIPSNMEFFLKNYNKEDINKYYNNEETFVDKSNNKQLNWQILERLINKANLSEREKNYLQKYYFDELNYRQIGEKYGLSHERIRQIIERALNKIKKIVQKENIEIDDFYEINRES